MDAFSELNGVRLKGDVLQGGVLGPGGSRRLTVALAPTLAPAPHMLIYHFVVDGSARGVSGRRA